ncbi:MAG: hypothetical protein OXC12_17110, partial [Spirochaetaceae bacterium]|nr:hypothetical protein [Spirochaetaceae bacterium]
MTSRVEIGAAGTAVRTRLAYDAGWGRIGAVAAVEPGADRPLLVVTGLHLPSALIGPVRLSGAWRELARPLGHDAATRVYGERTRLLPATGINPGRLRGVQLEPLPGVGLAGFLEPGAAAAGASPRTANRYPARHWRGLPVPLNRTAHASGADGASPARLRNSRPATATAAARSPNSTG